MQWRVEVLNETVRAELNALPEDMRAKLTRIMELIGQLGLPALREPYVKHIEGKLWEMRLTGRNGIARALYITTVNRRVVIVRVFEKKTQQTPKAEIDIALERAKEVR